MKVCVAALWHLGTVTAACVAEADITVTGFDFDAATAAGPQNGAAPPTDFRAPGSSSRP